MPPEKVQKSWDKKLEKSWDSHEWQKAGTAKSWDSHVSRT